VLDSYFNFTKKFNLVGNLYFEKLVVAYFFGPPCRLAMSVIDCQLQLPLYIRHVSGRVRMSM